MFLSGCKMKICFEQSHKSQYAGFIVKMRTIMPSPHSLKPPNRWDSPPKSEPRNKFTEENYNVAVRGRRIRK